MNSGRNSICCVFVLRRVARVVRDQRVLVVDRRQGGAVRRRVDEAAAADAVRLDDQVRRHRQVAEDARAFGDAAMARARSRRRSPTPAPGPSPARPGKKLQYDIMSPATA